MTHTVVRYKIVRDNTGIHEEIPVILTEFGPLQPLIQYILKHWHTLSQSNTNKLMQAVGLLIDYMEANHQVFDNPQDLFGTFVQRLYSGTVGVDGSDPSGLYWNSRTPPVVRVMVNHLSKFSDWLAAEQGTKQLNPWRQATRAEEQLAWAAWHHGRNRVFLSHTMSIDVARLKVSQARTVLLKKTPLIDHDPVKYFPADRMQDLLFRGFIVPGKQNSPRIEERLNLRDILITMLMHYGGLRVSEPFHLFLHDVTHDDTDPGSALVRVFHPSLGQAPADLRDAKGKPVACDRTTYLRDKHGLQPRTEYKSSHTLHAGWKGNALDSKQKFMHVHWAPLWAGSLFWKLWVFYMAQRDQFNPGDHPYAFVTREGKPYSIEAYEDAHANAIKRIGLVSAKALGTTPHGHRHAYGQRLSDLHLDAKFLMKALHHKSLESQIVYTEPDRVKLNRAIDAALKVKQLEDSQRNCERNDVPFLKGRELETLTKHTETQALTVTKLRNDLAATYHLLGRSIQIANDFQNKSVQLVANGSMVDLKLGFIETKSEFHQLEVVCENAVIHPNPDADFATIRRAQMIDAMLRFNGMDPVLMHLTPEQQLLAGNAVMKLIQARTGSIEGSLPFAECRAKLKNIGLLHDDVVNEIAQISAEVPAKELIDHAKAKYILSPPKEEINDAS